MTSCPGWLGLVQGVALLVLGALCLSAPGATIVVLVQLTGLYWLITGILGLIGLISDRSGWLWKVFAGVIGILAGMAIVAHPLWSSILVPTTLVIVIGIFGIVNGILVMIQSWGVRRWSGVILGLVGALLGLVLVANPLIGAATLPFVLGLFAIVGGVMSIAMAWFERRARRAIASEEAAPARRRAGCRRGRSGAGYCARARHPHRPRHLPPPSPRRPLRQLLPRLRQTAPAPGAGRRWRSGHPGPERFADSASGGDTRRRRAGPHDCSGTRGRWMMDVGGPASPGDRPLVRDPPTSRTLSPGGRHMPLGPVELLVLKYYGDHFTGVPAAQIQALADAGAIRIIDALFARKGEDGKVRVFELHELEDENTGHLDPIVDEISGLLNHDDILSLTDAWEPKTAGAVLLFENVWARKFREAVTEAGGQVVLQERIPRAVIEELERARDDELVTQ